MGETLFSDRISEWIGSVEAEMKVGESDDFQGGWKKANINVFRYKYEILYVSFCLTKCS